MLLRVLEFTLNIVVWWRLVIRSTLSTVNLASDFYSSLERICWIYVYSYLKEKLGISTADMNFGKNELKIDCYKQKTFLDFYFRIMIVK